MKKIECCELGLVNTMVTGSLGLIVGFLVSDLLNKK